MDLFQRTEGVRFYPVDLILRREKDNIPIEN